MAADLHTAQKQFEENLKFLGPDGPRTEPEKFNLYAGLANLAGGLAALASQVASIQNELRRRS
jgi:hypothetical protein